jgi:hypothetical protein
MSASMLAQTSAVLKFSDDLPTSATRQASPETRFFSSLKVPENQT